MEILNKIDTLLEDLKKKFSDISENGNVKFRFQNKATGQTIDLSLIDKNEILGAGFTVYVKDTCKGIVYGDDINTVETFTWHCLSEG